MAAAMAAQRIIVVPSQKSLLDRWFDPCPRRIDRSPLARNLYPTTSNNIEAAAALAGIRTRDMGEGSGHPWSWSTPHARIRGEAARSYRHQTACLTRHYPAMVWLV